ncbi:hypothetical protein R1flu_004766 [Riccia fluitans]|uniref:Legume lectin domain-containing protein n=1 Tax=Riccia fluitans TaxID=41844 RepID=A0ABD1YR86_9MARC
MAASSPSGPLWLLSLAVLAIGFAAGQLCRNNVTGFRFELFDCSRDRQLICTGDSTSTADGQLNLTRYDMKSSGRVMFAQGIRLMDRVNSKVAYFSTNFTFSMKADYSRPGEGFAFVMQASRGHQGHSGGFLGIFNKDGKAGTPIIAVEFDTFREWFYGFFMYNDINSNHVGVDIESINSKVQVDASSVGIDLGREKSVTAWVDYVPASEIFEGNLQVRISNDNVRPFFPLISYDIDLSKHISEIMYLGFSATTGDHMVTSDCLSYHNILSWSFDSWWEDSNSPPASPPPSPPVAPPPPSILPPVPLPPEPPSPVVPPPSALPPVPSPDWPPSPSAKPPPPSSPAPSPAMPIAPSPSPSGVLPPSPAPYSPTPYPVSPPSSYFPPPVPSPLPPESSPSPSPGFAPSSSSPAPAPVPGVPTPAPASLPPLAPPSGPSPPPAPPHLDSTRPMAASVAGFALLFSLYVVVVYTRVLSELGKGREDNRRLEYLGDQTMIGIWPTDRKAVNTRIFTVGYSDCFRHLDPVQIDEPWDFT